MQVETTAAPATATHGGRTFYFCSDHCQRRFQTDPDHYTAVVSDSDQAEPRSEDAKAGNSMDGKSVDATSAAPSVALDAATAASQRRRNHS